MSHFAEVVDVTGQAPNRVGRVARVIVAEQGFIDRLPGWWVQTSYNTHGGVHAMGGTPLRKNYAGSGHTYDEGRDAFHAPQPFPSWTLNEESFLWEPIVPRPPGDQWVWDELALSWVEGG